MWNIKDKTVLITGGTSGIGKETALELARLGANLILPVRNIKKGEELKNEILKLNKEVNISLFNIDLSDFTSVKKCSEEILNNFKKIDVLINNAGGIYNVNEVSQDRLNLAYQTNHFSHFLLTLNLLPLVKASENGRIINVSSGAHYLSKLTENIDPKAKLNPMTSYANAKLMNILFTKSLKEKLIGTQVSVNSLHPGVVKTNFANSLGIFGLFFKMVSIFGISSKEGAQTSIYLATSDEVSEVTGGYFDKKKITGSSPLSNNKELGDSLWEVSMNVVKEYLV